jgi:hypothetical protein
VKDANNVKRLKIYLTFIVTSTEFAIYQQRRLVNFFFFLFQLKYSSFLDAIPKKFYISIFKMFFTLIILKLMRHFV